MFSNGQGGRSIAAVALFLVLSASVLPGEELYFEKRDLAVLTVPSINCIVEDHRGYLWLGSPGGLVRYDGRKPSLINRKSHPSLPADQITALEYDPVADELWIGTIAGPVRLELKTGEMVPVVFRRTAGNYINTEVTDIVSGPDEQIFVVMGGAVFYSIGGGPFEIVSVETAGSESGEIIDIARGTDDSIWAVSTDGLKRWGPGSGEFSHVQGLRGAVSISAVGNDLWIGYNRESVSHFNPSDQSMISYPSPRETSSIISGPDGRIWIGSRMGGITIIDPAGKQIVYCDVDRDHPFKLPSGRISVLFSGASGHIWVGTADSGLFSTDPNKKNHLTYTKKSGSDSLPAGLIQVIFEDSLGYIWAGSDIAGLSRIDPSTGGLRLYESRDDDYFSLGGDQISDMMEDSTGKIWVGTDQGPYLYLPEVEGFEPAGGMMNGWPDFQGESVLALAEGNDGSIWISFRNGELFRLDSRDRDHTVFRFTTNSVPLVLLTDHQGELWAGSRTNLRLFSGEGDLIKTWTPDGASGIPEGGISSIFEDSRGRIWIGGPTGLAYYTGYSSGFQSVGVPGETSAEITGIAEDVEGNIWVSDGFRVHCFNPAGSYLGTMNGLAGLTPSGLIRSLEKDSNGNMLLGASGEIWSFDRPFFPDLPEPPTVYLTEIRVLNKLLAEGHALDGGYFVGLTPDDNIFSMSFGAVDYRFRSVVGFQYRLTDFHEDWVDAGSTDSVTYAKLPPGEYQFSVRAYDELGSMSGESALLTLRIEPVFWRTLPAILIYLIVLGIIIGIVFKLWEGRLLKGQILELEEARKKVLIANEKLSYQTKNDSLTGLLNRRGFDQGINLALETARRNNLIITLIMMDVDFFKLYNDNYGHVQGDEVLRSVGKTLRSVFERSTDIIARYGGEEFAVVFIGDNPNASVTLANDLILGIESLDISHEFSTVSPRLTLSAGSATMRCDTEMAVDFLIRRADKALYAAKSGGRDRICFTGMIPMLPEVMKNQLRPLTLDTDTPA